MASIIELSKYMIINAFKLFILSLMLFSLLAKAESLEADNIWENYDITLKSLPKDAARTLDHAVDCYHLSGEINGDSSQNDKNIIRRINKLKCDEVEQKVLFIRNKYKTNKSVQEAFRIYYLNE